MALRTPVKEAQPVNLAPKNLPPSPSVHKFSRARDSDQKLPPTTAGQGRVPSPGKCASRAVGNRQLSHQDPKSLTSWVCATLCDMYLLLSQNCMHNTLGGCARKPSKCNSRSWVWQVWWQAGELLDPTDVSRSNLQPRSGFLWEAMATLTAASCA